LSTYNKTITEEFWTFTIYKHSLKKPKFTLSSFIYIRHYNMVLFIYDGFHIFDLIINNEINKINDLRYIINIYYGFDTSLSFMFLVYHITHFLYQHIFNLKGVIINYYVKSNSYHALEKTLVSRSFKNADIKEINKFIDDFKRAWKRTSFSDYYHESSAAQFLITVFLKRPAKIKFKKMIIPLYKTKKQKRNNKKELPLVKHDFLIDIT
jgi:hypothetical protein